MAIDGARPLMPLREKSRELEIDHQAGLSSMGSKESKEAALKKAAQEFEALFIYQMLKAMRQTVPDDGLFKGVTGKDTYLDITDQQFASTMAKEGGMGLADLIYKSMLPRLEETQGMKENSGAPHKLEETQGTNDKPAVPAGLEKPGGGKEGFVPPLSGGVVSSPYGMRLHPILGVKAMHEGIDIAAPQGTEVQATAGGRVLFSGWLPNYGNTVMVEHSGGLVSLYAHNESNAVQTYQKVDQGQVIAHVGSTGRSTGPHLHFEIRKGDNPMDPKALGLFSSGDRPLKG